MPPIQRLRTASALAASIAFICCASFAPAQAALATAPETWTVTLPGGLVQVEMVKVPGGTLARADGTVEVGSFWMARTELTWDAFDVLVFRLDLPEEQRVRDVDGVTRPTKPYILVDRGFGHAGYPALSMSQKGAESFCAWLSEASGRRFRLPTVDEWEYAARAGSPTIYGCGDEAALDEHAWFRDNANRKTQPVATRTPNAFGLFDLHGNVSEWALRPDGVAVQCGGSFRDPAGKIGADARREAVPAWNASDPQMPKSVWWLADANFVGMRLVCDPAANEPEND
jgi:formylglycine-generating enzyme required for sulfatase activity